jgi:hypothetical protein
LIPLIFVQDRFPISGCTGPLPLGAPRKISGPSSLITAWGPGGLSTSSVGSYYSGNPGGSISVSGIPSGGGWLRGKTYQVGLGTPWTSSLGVPSQPINFRSLPYFGPSRGATMGVTPNKISISTSLHQRLRAF